MYESDLIAKAGLTSGEAKVYLALLGLGSSSAGPIIEKSGVARSFIYNILNHLIEKGLVSYVQKNSTRFYQAAEPSRIMDYLEVQKQELEKKKKELEVLLPKLLLVQSESSQTQVNVFEGFKGVQTCFERYEQKLKKGDEYLALGIFAEQTEVYHAYWSKHQKLRVKQSFTCRMLFNTNTAKSILENRNSYKGCDSRYMPSDIRTPAWFYIYGDVVGIFLQSPLQLAIEITNKEIAQTFKAYFEDYWRLSQPFKR